MTISRFERWLIWSSTAATFLTGIVYWWMKDLMTPVEPWAVINHALQPAVLKSHILAAPVLVFAVGLITTRHVWRHFRQGVRKGRRSGLLAAGTFVLLVASGYVLQVITAEALLRALGWAHLGLGVVYSAGLALHWPATRTRTVRAPDELPHPSSRPGARPAPALDETGLPDRDRRRRRTAGASR